MEVTLIPVTTTEDINTLAALAKGIWEEHFSSDYRAQGRWLACQRNSSLSRQ